MKTDIRPHLAILAGNILFGLNFIYSKQLIPQLMSPETLAIWRVTIGALLLIITVLALKRWRIEAKDIFKLAIAGLLGMAGNQLIFLKGLAFTSPITAAIISTAGPVVVMILSAIFLKDKITRRRLVGIVIALSGAVVAILSDGGKASFSSDHLKGNLLVVCSCLSYSLYVVWVKPLLNKYNPLTVVAYAFTAASLFMFMFIGDSFVDLEPSRLVGKALFQFIAVLFGATFLAYTFIAYGLKRVSPTITSIYSYSQPIITSLLAAMYGQSDINSFKVIAALLVFGGVYIATLQKKFKPFYR